MIGFLGHTRSSQSFRCTHPSRTVTNIFGHPDASSVNQQPAFPRALIDGCPSGMTFPRLLGMSMLGILGIFGYLEPIAKSLRCPFNIFKSLPGKTWFFVVLDKSKNRPGSTIWAVQILQATEKIHNKSGSGMGNSNWSNDPSPLQKRCWNSSAPPFLYLLKGPPMGLIYFGQSWQHPPIGWLVNHHCLHKLQYTWDLLGFNPPFSDKPISNHILQQNTHYIPWLTVVSMWFVPMVNLPAANASTAHAIGPGDPQQHLQHVILKLQRWHLRPSWWVISWFICDFHVECINYIQLLLIKHLCRKKTGCYISFRLDCASVLGIGGIWFWSGL